MNAGARVCMCNIINECVRVCVHLFKHMQTKHLILFVIRLSGVGSRGEQLKQGAPDFPFPGHIDQL